MGSSLCGRGVCGALVASAMGSVMNVCGWPDTTVRQTALTDLLGGELTLRLPPAGERWHVSFASPYELNLREEGRRFAPRYSHRGGPVAVWAHSRCPALYNALGRSMGLVVCINANAEGHAEVVPLDVHDRKRGIWLAHGPVREILSAVRVAGAPLTLLGEVTTLAELETRMAALVAPGTQVEVRREEAGAVVASALAVVDVARAQGRR